jgi:hypothetical protein
MIATFQAVPAIEQAVQIYARHGLTLARDLEAYLRHPLAHVVKTPDLLLLARPVVLADFERWLDEPGAADAWYIRLLVGRPGAALREMPHTLPWCCWHRNFRTPGGRLHVVATDQLIKKLRPYYGR